MAGAERRVALVTGAGRGIGAATVCALTAAGLRVVAADWCGGSAVDQDRLPYPQSTRADLDATVARAGHLAEPLVMDVRDADSVRVEIKDLHARYGRLDVVVAAAAIMLGGQPLWEAPEADLDLQWEINVKGIWNSAAAAVPLMVAGPDPRGCRFIALASAAASHGLYHLTAYTMVKHAVAGLVRGLAADLIGTGVSVVGVSPGSTRTAMLDATAGFYGLPSVDDFASHHLLGRLLEPEEIAATISHLVSPAGGALNGTIVEVDGGFGV